MSRSAVPHGDDESVVAFSTSGHTGQPVWWLRTREQLQAEVELVGEVAIGEIEQVVCFAPPHHIFGRLFGRELPGLRQIPVVDGWSDPTVPPSFRPGRATLFVCLPASWLLIRSMIDRIAALPRSVALHGTAPVPAKGREVITSLREADFRAVEIFGSTETGGVAVRDMSLAGPPPPWALLPDVELVRDGQSAETLLTVRSGRLARRQDMTAAPDHWQLGDVIRLTDDRHFHFVGRTSRLVKINGIRCDLGVVERAVAAGLPTVDVVCVAVEDDTRAEHYDLYYADPRGHVAEEAVVRVIVDRLGTPPPRRVHQVPVIPRSDTGKPRLAALVSALNPVWPREAGPARHQ